MEVISIVGSYSWLNLAKALTLQGSRDWCAGAIVLTLGEKCVHSRLNRGDAHDQSNVLYIKLEKRGQFLSSRKPLKITNNEAPVSAAIADHKEA